MVYHDEGLCTTEAASAIENFRASQESNQRKFKFHLRLFTIFEHRLSIYLVEISLVKIKLQAAGLLIEKNTVAT